MSMSNTEKTVKDIRRNTRRKFSTEEKIRIVLDGLRGESSVAELCRREGIVEEYCMSDTRLVNANNSNLGDGDRNSSRFYQSDLGQFGNEAAMYNSPKNPRDERDSIGNIAKKYDTKFRSTLIGDNTRVYKGGSWSDREYWLDPAQRRYLPEYMSTNFIGFRCATDKVGPMTSTKRTARNAKR